MKTTNQLSDLDNFAIHTNDNSFDSIALELEYQYFNHNWSYYNEVYNFTEYYNSSWVESDEEIDSSYTFLHNPKPISFSLINNSGHSFNISYPKSLQLTTWYELILITKFKQKEYKTPMTIQISQWNITNWVNCNQNISNVNCIRWIPGYAPDSSHPKPDTCKKFYSIAFTRFLYNLLKVISATTTVCFAILLLKREKLLMHIVIYIENKLLFIFIALLYRQYIPYDLYFNFSNDLVEEFAVYYPFYPLPNFLLYLSKITGLESHYLDEDSYLYYDKLSMLGFFWSGIVVLSILILIVLLLINWWKHYKILKIINNNLILLNTWYALATSLLFPVNYFIIIVGSMCKCTFTITFT